MRGIIFITFFVSTLVGMARTITGFVKDEENNPAEFVNVVLLEDSVFIDGRATDKSGAFLFENAAVEVNRAKISMVGYEDIVLTVPADGNLGTIVLRPAAVALGEVTVNHLFPTTRLKDDAFVTRVENSILATSGSANEVLSQLPMVNGENGKFRVFGVGEAVIYINNRKVRDSNEMSQLASSDIKEVRVITTPGVQYGSNVGAVIKIITKKPAGDGFSINASTRQKYNKWYASDNDFGLKYRTGGLEVFGNGYFNFMKTHVTSDICQTNYGPVFIEEKSSNPSYSTSKNIAGKLGFNYLIGNNHSFGAYYQHIYNDFHVSSRYLDEIFENGTLTESSNSYKKGQSKGKPNHNANIYYTGSFGKFSIDADVDYIWNKNRNENHTYERNLIGIDREVSTFSTFRTRLFAQKTSLSYNLPKGNVSIGEEYSDSRVSTDYHNPQNIISSDFTEVKERNLGVFAYVFHKLGPVRMTAGLRYEHVISDYYLNNLFVAGQSRTYNHLIPSLTLSYNRDELGLSLNYTRMIDRPKYSMLSGSYNYISSISYSRGNPALKSATLDDFTLQASWKYFLAFVSYTYYSNAMIQVNEPYPGDPRITVFTNINGRRRDMLMLSVNASPTFGIYRLSLTAQLLKQWYRVDFLGGPKAFNTPQFIINWRNFFSFPHDWGAEVAFWCRGAGDSMNVKHTRALTEFDIQIYKKFLNKSLIVYLVGVDIFNGMPRHYELYSGNIKMQSDMDNFTRSIRLTVRYNFNVTKSRYMGRGAGQSEKQRL